jgi:hypothetical protein
LPGKLPGTEAQILFRLQIPLGNQSLGHIGRTPPLLRN